MVKLALFDRALGSKRTSYGSTGNLEHGTEDKQQKKRNFKYLDKCLTILLFTC